MIRIKRSAKKQGLMGICQQNSNTDTAAPAPAPAP